jgi:hypothetical protein
MKAGAAPASPLAARLQGVAKPNTVVLAESTRKLLGTLLEFEISECGTSRVSWDRAPLGRYSDQLRWRVALRPFSSVTVRCRDGLPDLNISLFNHSTA